MNLFRATLGFVGETNKLLEGYANLSFLTVNSEGAFEHFLDHLLILGSQRVDSRCKGISNSVLYRLACWENPSVMDNLCTATFSSTSCV